MSVDPLSHDITSISCKTENASNECKYKQGCDDVHNDGARCQNDDFKQSTECYETIVSFFLLRFHTKT